MRPGPHTSASWSSSQPLNLMTIKIFKALCVHTHSIVVGWSGVRYLDKGCVLDYLGDLPTVTGHKIPRSLSLLLSYTVDNFFTIWQEMIWAKHSILPLGK